MATVIIFNDKGRPFWKSVKTAPRTMSQPNQVIFTDADKVWFKKPLGK